MEYPGEGTATRIDGMLHPVWSANDPLWGQVDAGTDSNGFAVSFRETGYEKKGSSSISFDGEYRAIVSGTDLTGAWFSGMRLVGTIALRKV
jgi:hypothetical protein